MGERSDAALIEAMAGGDRGALAELYDRYAGLLLAIGVRILRDRREAEDVLHDVVVEMWRRAGDFDPDRGAARTWITLRMRSRCLDRRKRLRPAVELEPEVVAGAAADPAGAVDGARVRAVMAALSAEQREVIELGYFGGLSSAEIAERIAVPIGTVKSRVAAALARLRKELVA